MGMVLNFIIFIVLFFGVIRNLVVFFIRLRWNSNIHDYRLKILHDNYGEYLELSSSEEMYDRIGNPYIMILKFWCWTTKSFFKKGDIEFFNTIK